MRATIAVIVSAFVLAASSPASGVCAWVLWAEWGGGPPIVPEGAKLIPLTMLSHKILGAYASKAECDRAQRADPPPQGYSRAFCLPDTIRP